MDDIIPKLANSGILSLLLIAVASAHAGKLHLLDRPGGRKQHIGAVPTVGGICIYCAFVLGLSLDPHLLAPNMLLVVTMGLLAVLGAVDDVIDIDPAKKLLFETILAGTLIAVTGVSITDIGGILRVDDLIGAALATLMVVCIINAVNHADGVDGLAGWLIVVALSWLVIGAALVGDHDLGGLVIRLGVPVLAFLVFNSRTPWRHKAAVFMGDAGTLMLGYAIAWLCFDLSRDGISVIGSSLVVAVPVSDTIGLFFRRLLSGRNPLPGARDHIHHLLEEAGLAPGTISFVLAAISAFIGGIGILGAYAGVPPQVFLLVWILVFACDWAVVLWLGRRVSRLHLQMALK
ncbi:MAG TPA: MraY family glycosyltransferase [Alphaproteobacteria bacterium]|jgi:UDP-GlcNAc:undecaprenyl-phosphate GlcNAc-1-phosphate transferase|nr:MraY family glycosyltransferase [Alphaproteobacteria bacterium]